MLLPKRSAWSNAAAKVAIDLNAVPPHGHRRRRSRPTRPTKRDGVACYGAIGVGGTKMKIHKAAIAKLFERNNQVLDAEEIFHLGCELGSVSSKRRLRAALWIFIFVPPTPMAP